MLSEYLASRADEAHFCSCIGNSEEFFKIKKTVDTTMKALYNAKHNKPSKILGNKKRKLVYEIQTRKKQEKRNENRDIL